jgi:hypothetical protein
MKPYDCGEILWAYRNVKIETTTVLLLTSLCIGNAVRDIQIASVIAVDRRLTRVPIPARKEQYCHRENEE